MWSDLIHRLRAVFRRKTIERELDDELRFHMEKQVEKYTRAGHSAGEAARRVQLEFGGLDQVKEDYRDALGASFLDTIAQDIRYGVRTLRRNPGFTTVAVLSLALGIGANTAIFGLFDALMLRWLPVRDPQELVQVKMQIPGDSGSTESFSYSIVRGLADQKEIFAGAAGFSAASFDIGAPGSAAQVPGAMVTGAYYETLGLNPVIGRLLARGDDETGAPLVTVISDGYWERRFGRDPGVVGRVLQVNGIPVTITGVSPPGFVGANVGSIADITMPVAALPRISPESAALLGAGNFWLRVLARPRPGVSIPEAQARLAVVWTQISDGVIAAHWPVKRREAMAEAVFQFSPGGTGWTRLREIYRKPLLVLMAAVSLVLLIACANVASLLLARASARHREIAVRLAIGAGRRRIVRQLLTESLLLAFAGAAFGIALAWVSGRSLLNIISTAKSVVVFDLTPNWHILSFTIAVAIVTAVLFGLAPAFQTTAAGPAPALKEDSRMSGSRSLVLPSLVSIQVALSLLLLIGAGLFVRTLQNLRSLDPGFNREGVLIADIEGRRTAFPMDLLDQVGRLPGVLSASISTHTPLSGSLWSEPAVPEGQPIPERDNAIFVGAGPRFFETMQIRLLSGREFTERDSSDSPGVAVVNEVFAQRHFSNQNPVGQYLSANVRGRRRNLEIIGVARNTNSRALRAAPPPTVYVSYGQLTGDFPTALEIRAGGGLGQAASAVRDLLQSKLGRTLEVRTLSAQVEATMVQERMMATLAGGFGILALILSCVGVYGLLAYSIARRTKEMGIRMALGAQRSRLIGSVLRGALRLVMIGIVLGLPMAWAASHWAESMLFRLKPTDPATIVEAILLLTASALVAAFLPAWRASRVDPTVALRHD